MLIHLKVKTLDARTHDFSIDNEITIREFKTKIAEKTCINAENQRIIYQGRVLADDKKMKDYDVDGKVLHVAERPPFSQRGAHSRNNDEPRHSRHARGSGSGSLRNSPLFRALDGMLVGTMTIPVNAQSLPTQPVTAGPLATSSSFCMNRITVARHMIDCANNIAAYLENPEVGLNNSSLDILERGRWTMESTVVEVGVSSDLPRNQNLMDMVQGAVTAALSRNNQGRNYTVLQLPPVYTSDNGPGTSDDTTTDANATSTEHPNGQEDNTAPAAAAVIIEDVIEAEDEALTEGTANNEPQTAQTPTGTSTANEASSPNGANPRRNTRTEVLAEVIDQYRRVETRLNPFYDQYYNLLRNEPSFTEEQTAEREQAQRIYDRVSEAFHYLSHAQHAISDLMLDLSQPAPRFLTCRPILVEQSGYIRSNNILAPNVIATTIRPQNQQQQQQSNERNSESASNTASTSSLPENATNAAAEGTQSQAAEAAPMRSNAAEPNANATVEDPVDDPMVAPNQPPQASANTAGGAQNQADNPQVQMARLIQAVVNSATADAELHFQINAPNLMAINVPEMVQGSRIRSLDEFDLRLPRINLQTENAAGAPAASAAAAAASAGGGSGGEHQVSVTTNTLPTTSTQTRATSRPQIQIGSNNNWNGRLMPSNTAFDRFLPCNSHHIREPEHATPANNSNNRSVDDAAGATVAAAGGADNQNQQTSARSRSIPRVNRSTQSSERTNVTTMTEARTSTSDSTAIINLRTQLQNFLHRIVFQGAPINDDTIPTAVNRALAWFGESLIFLPQYEKPEYNSRDSVCNIFRSTLTLVINLLSEENLDNNGLFETRLKQICEQFRTRLYSVLFVCVGRDNAEIYWGQLMRLLLVPLETNFHHEALQFLCIYLNPTIPSSTDTADVQQFLVLRSTTASNGLTTNSVDSDVEMLDIATTADTTNTESTAANTTTTEPEPILPNVVPGTEPWHNNFPAEWLPVVTRDLQTQAEQTQPQTPYSDAYISGMSAKRRKIIQSSKPPANVEAMIAENVRRAVQSSAINSNSNSSQTSTPDLVANAVARDPAVQASYTQAVRNNLRERIKTDPNYKPDKFPHTAKFIDKK